MFSTSFCNRHYILCVAALWKRPDQLVVHYQSNCGDTCPGGKPTHKNPSRPGLLSSSCTFDYPGSFWKVLLYGPHHRLITSKSRGKSLAVSNFLFKSLKGFCSIATVEHHCSRPFKFLNFCFPYFPRRCMTKYINNNNSVIGKMHKRIKENIPEMEGTGQTNEMGVEEAFQSRLRPWRLGVSPLALQEYFLEEGGKSWGSVHSLKVVN